jgi:flagellar FliJ protein
MTALEAQLQALDADVQATNEDVRKNRLIGTIDLQFLTAHRRYLGATQRRAMEIAERMAAVRIKLDDARRHLAEAAKDRKILEKLRERQEEAWRADLRRREAAETEEIASQMTYRKMLSGEDR